MVEVELGDLALAVGQLSSTVQAIEALGKDPAKYRGRVLTRLLSVALQSAEAMAKIAKATDLDATEASAERLSMSIRALRDKHLGSGHIPLSDIDLDAIMTDSEQTVTAATDQLRKRYALILTSKERQLYDPPEPLFGQAVFDSFPDARDDIDEAGKCLALGRGKATVCHLMLAMEEALRVLATTLGAEVQDKNGKWLTWLTIANHMEPPIKNMPEGEAKERWWEVRAMLQSVGKAWRNPSMHPARSYDVAQATKVFEAVRGFMGDLAALV